MVALTGCVTGDVAIRNSASRCPSGIRTVGATRAALASDWRFTNDPPTGAGDVPVTMPVTGPPPNCELGRRVIVGTFEFPAVPGCTETVPVADSFEFDTVTRKDTGASMVGTINEKLALV